MYPATSLRNFTPTSIGWPSLAAGFAGVAVAPQTLQGQTGGSGVFVGVDGVPVFVAVGSGVFVGVDGSGVFVGVLVGVAVGPP